MSRLRFGLIAAVALALPLLAAENSFAQWRIGWGWGGWRGGNYGGWGYSSPWYGSSYSYWPAYRYSSYWPYSNYYTYWPYSSYYTYTYPYSNYYTYSYPYSYTYSYPSTYSYYPYYSGSTHSSPTVYYSSPTMYSNAYVSGTSSPGTYSTTQSFYPSDTQGNMPALIDVQVPPDAQIWFDGESTSQTGTERTFRSPPLQPGQDYSYEVKAHWMANGKDIERTRKVHVHAGERVFVNFMANEEGLGTPTRSGLEGTGTTPRPATEGTGTPPATGTTPGSETTPRPPSGGTGTTSRSGSGL
jgi:uncharacterized protein (TIGR03000 family)